MTVNRTTTVEIQMPVASDEAQPFIVQARSRGRNWKVIGGACCLATSLAFLISGAILVGKDCEIEPNDSNSYETCLTGKHVYAPIVLGTALLTDCVSCCFFLQGLFE